MKRLVVIAALLLAVAAGALLWFVRFSLDGRVAAAIEAQGSAMTLAPVRVDGLHLDLRGGRGTIRDISVDNPAGFPPGTALSLAGIEIAIDVASLGGDPIVIREIHVGAPHVTVLLAEDGRMSVDALRRNVRDYPDRVAATEAPPAATDPDPGTGPEPARERRVRIEELTIAEGVIRLDGSPLGREPRELPLGSVELRDLGGERGATPEQLGRRVADALIARTARAVAGAELERTLREKGGEIGGKLGELLRKGIDR